MYLINENNFLIGESGKEKGNGKIKQFIKNAINFITTGIGKIIAKIKALFNKKKKSGTTSDSEGNKGSTESKPEEKTESKPKGVKVKREMTGRELVVVPNNIILRIPSSSYLSLDRKSVV